jgi:translation initiation factor IF-3
MGFALLGAPRPAAALLRAPAGARAAAAARRPAAAPLVVARFSGGGRSAAPYRPPRPAGSRPPGGGGRGRGGGRPERPRGPLANEDIRAPEVRLLGEDREALGVMPTEAALELAREAGLDLVLVVPDAQPPVARIIELSKLAYEAARAAKDAKKRQREAQVETKELKLRPGTDVHDYQVRLRAAQRFLEKGHRVKLVLQFRGREMQFRELGDEMFARMLADLGEAAAVESPAAMQGRSLVMVLGAPKVEEGAAGGGGGGGNKGGGGAPRAPRAESAPRAPRAAAAEDDGAGEAATEATAPAPEAAAEAAPEPAAAAAPAPEAPAAPAAPAPPAEAPAPAAPAPAEEGGLLRRPAPRIIS